MMLANLVIVGLVGCGANLPPPVPEGMSPDKGFNGEDTISLITGSDFYPTLEVDARRTDAAQVDGQFRAFLVGPVDADEPVDTRLTNVDLVDYGTLGAVVPAGLSPGLYDLRVVSPGGLDGLLTEAFTVTNTQADRLTVDSERLSYTVNEPAQLDVALLDTTGERLLQDFQIDIQVTDADDQPFAATFFPGGLEDQEVLDDGSGIRGWLGDDDGKGVVLMTVDKPGVYTVTASPVNSRLGVSPGTMKLDYTPGTDLSLVITIPGSGGPQPFQAVAGTSFEAELQLFDEFGNPIDDEAPFVALRNACNSWADVATLAGGRATVDITLTEATTLQCPVDHIIADQFDGQSKDILVAPAEADHFVVTVFNQEVTAGDDLLVIVRPEDAFGNAATWTGDLTLSDSVGGVGPGDFNCAGTTPMTCIVNVTAAGSAIQLTATGDDGLTGVSNAYTVVPGPPASVIVTGPQNATAGDPFLVQVQVEDEFGNIVDADDIPGSDYTLTDALGELVCSETAAVGGVAQFDCILTTAASAARVDVDVDGIADSTSSFPVFNGAIAAVTAVPDSTTVVAGDPLSVTFAAVDAFGNAYIIGPKQVQLSDGSGSLDPSSVQLDSTGSAVIDVSFTTAGAWSIDVERNSVPLGSSDPITVTAAGAERLTVTVEEPWVWTGIPAEVRVRAVDAFDNVADFDGNVTLSSSSGSASDVGVTLSNGVGAGQLTWTATRFVENVDATDGATLTGTSSNVIVVEDCAVGGPTIDMQFGGNETPIACHDDGATVIGDFSGSVSGGSSFVWYVLAGPDGVDQGGQDVRTIEIDEVGSHTVRGLAAQGNGCGAAATTTAWVGPDDGTPVGPVELVPVDSQIFALGGATSVDLLGVVDCSGDPASSQAVFVRSDRASLVANPSGMGLFATLDGNGDAIFDLDATGVLSGGFATITAYVPSGAAGGTTTVEIVGDSQRPQIWFQDPTGDTTGLISQLRLRFSEPLLPATVVPATFDLPGATIDAVTLEGADDEVVIDLLDPIDATSGAFALTATTSIRDAAGNKIDGAWAGTNASQTPASDYVGVFGAVPSTVSPVDSCEVDLAAFRPDGDDGLDVEADFVLVDWTSVDVPSWWTVTILPLEGTEPVRLEYVQPSGANDSWVFDGRDTSGAVLPNGAYDIVVDAVDANGNRGGSCATSVTIDNLGESP